MSKPTLKAAFLGEACRDFVIEGAPFLFLLLFHVFAVAPQVELTGCGHLFQVLLGVCLEMRNNTGGHEWSRGITLLRCDLIENVVCWVVCLERRGIHPCF